MASLEQWVIWLNIVKLEFICVIGIVPTYLGKWGKRVNFGNSVTEIQQKYKREREKVGERKFWISVIIEIPAARTKEKKIVAIVAMSLSKMGRKKNSGCWNLGRN